jgi:serine protease Do
MKRYVLLLFLGCCASVGGALGVVVAPRLLTPANAQTPFAAPPLAPAAGDVSKLGERFEVIARRLAPTVVAIEAVKPLGNGTTKAKPVEESGSGVLVRIEGHAGVFVITNNHVIANAPPQQITISLADDRLIKPGRVWADPESDVALLSLPGYDHLPTASLGDSDAVHVGQWALAFGSPFGLNQTVTHGIISARERGQVSLGNTIRIKDFLQTDAAINPGSSGGPLVNLEGEVIGINTAIASNSNSSSGVAFSIPVNLVKRVVRQLIEKGSVTRGYLGMQLAPSFEAADALRLGLDRVQGALVEKIWPETPAAAAGLHVNDVILQIDNAPVRNENHLINTVSALPVGQKIRLHVWRERKSVVVDAVVGDWSRGVARLTTGQ